MIKSRDELKATINKLNSRYGKAVDRFMKAEEEARKNGLDAVIAKSELGDQKEENARLRKQIAQLLESASANEQILHETRESCDTFAGLADFWAKTFQVLRLNHKRAKARISAYHDDMAFIVCLNGAFAIVLYAVGF